MHFGLPFLFIPPGLPISPIPTGPTRHPGESLTDCMNRCLTERGLEARFTTNAIEACGLGMLALGTPATGPVRAITAPLALAGCLAFATGYDIGITGDCLSRCGEAPPEVPGMVAMLPPEHFAEVAEETAPPTRTGSIVVGGVSPAGMQLAMQQASANRSCGC